MATQLLREMDEAGLRPGLRALNNPRPQPSLHPHPYPHPHPHPHPPPPLRPGLRAFNGVLKACEKSVDATEAERLLQVKSYPTLP